MTTSEAQPASPPLNAETRVEERPDQTSCEVSAPHGSPEQTRESACEGAEADIETSRAPQPGSGLVDSGGARRDEDKASSGAADVAQDVAASADEGSLPVGDDARPVDAGAEKNAQDAVSGSKRKRKRGNKRDGDKASSAREPARGAFAPLFTSGPRRQAMAVGEFVAGLVDATGDGAFRLDLFGRGIAYVDVNEPDLKEVSEAEIAALRAESLSLDAAIAPAGGAGATITSGASLAFATGEASAAGDPVGAAVSDVWADASGAPQVNHGEAIKSEPNASETEPVSATPATSGDAKAEHSGDANDESGRATTTLATIEERARREAPKPDTIFRGRVVALAESGHLALVNRPVDVRRAAQVLEQAAAGRERVWGLVFGYNRGGFDVLVEGIRVFCPASSIDTHTPSEPKTWLGRKLQFHLSTKKSKGSDYVVTRRTIAERESRKRAGERLKHLKVGQKLKGVVTSVLDYALIVDLDGLEGFLHVSELSYDRETQPANLASIGDVLDVEVLRIEGSGRKDSRTKVSLTRKPFIDDPWDAHDEILTAGRPTEGIVRRVAAFGAFVELSPGIEGLLHESEYQKGPDRLPKPPEVGSTVTVVVDKVDKRAHRIGLSLLSELEAKAFEAAGRNFDAELLRKLKPGAELIAQVEKIDPRGVHLRIKGIFGRRGRGYMQSRELGEVERGALKKAPEGSHELKVKLVGFERDGTLKLSRRALVQDEERRAVQEYRKEASKQGFGTFADLLKAKLGG